METASSFVRLIIREWRKDELPRKSAAIAFYAIFSLPAFLMVIITIAGWFLDERTINNALLSQASMYVDARTLSYIEIVLLNMREQSNNVLLSITSFVVLLLSAMNIIHELRRSLNAILNAQRIAHKWQKSAWGYILSFLVLIVTATLIVFFVCSQILLSYFDARLRGVVTLPFDALYVVNHMLTYVGLIILFSFLYRTLPYKRYAPVLIVLCSVIVSSLLIIGTMLLSYGVVLLHFGRAFGVAASLVIIMLWIYYASAVFLVGGEVLEVCARDKR